MLAGSSARYRGLAEVHKQSSEGKCFAAFLENVVIQTNHDWLSLTLVFHLEPVLIP